MHPAALRAHSQSPCLARPSCILTSTALLLIDCSQLHTGLFPVPLMCQPLASPSAWNNRPSDILSHPQYFHALGKEMAPHSSTLAWRIPWTEEPGGLQSTGSQRVGHDWTTSLSFYFSAHLKSVEAMWKENESLLGRGLAEAEGPLIFTSFPSSFRFWFKYHPLIESLTSSSVILPTRPCFVFFFSISITLLGFPWWFSGKEAACNTGDTVLIPGFQRSPGEEISNLLQ